MEDKSRFIKSLRKSSNMDSNIYIPVRNRKSLFGSSGAGCGLLDLSIEEWIDLFGTNGFEVVKYSKLPRPWITGVSFNALKNVVVTSMDRLIPINLAYMILFELKASS